MSVGRLLQGGLLHSAEAQKHSTSSSQFQAESKLYATVHTVHPLQIADGWLCHWFRAGGTL
jgi:hypothetical protein